MSALSNMGVVAFFHRRKFRNRRHSAMMFPPGESYVVIVFVRHPPHSLPHNCN